MPSYCNRYRGMNATQRKRAIERDRKRVVRDFKRHKDNRIKMVAKRTNLPKRVAERYVDDYLNSLKPGKVSTEYNSICK